MDLDVVKAYNRLGLEEGNSRDEVERVYNQYKLKYLAKELSFEDWFEIDLSYTEVISYLDELDEYDAQERLRQKRILLIETEKMRRITNAIKEEEEHKGPLWVLLESLNISEIKNNNIDFWQYMEEKVLTVINPEYALKYRNFLRRLKELWDELYLEICKYEYELLCRGDLGSDCRFSVGMDELTISRFPRGKYKDLFDMGHELSSLIPDANPYYFIDRHFAILAQYVDLGYSDSSYMECPIYSFSPNTRLKKYREEYLEKFGEEVRSGVRKSPYVNNDELIGYVTKSLKPLNSYVK